MGPSSRIPVRMGERHTQQVAAVIIKNVELIASTLIQERRNLRESLFFLFSTKKSSLLSKLQEAESRKKK